jgi:hypothetical protein
MPFQKSSNFSDYNDYQIKYKRNTNTRYINNNGINIFKIKEFHLTSINKNYNNNKKKSIKRLNLKMNWNNRNMNIK